MAEVHVTPGVLREEDVAGHHDLLGRRRYPFETESGGDDALVHGPTGCQGGIFTVIGHGNAEGASEPGQFFGP